MDEHILLEFKKLLKSGRLKSGYNYKDLAEISGISDQTIRKYENAAEVDIPIKKLFYLLNILKVPKTNIIQLIQLTY
jgi:transcriptional regulator with XRE-family HTH domain